jgi:hypothetical protein
MFFLSPQKALLNKMDKEAKKLVNDVVKTCNNNYYDVENLYAVTCKLLSLDINRLNIELVNSIKKYCICIEGVCYFIGLNFRLQLSMKMRCAQFIAMIDKYLYTNDIKPCLLEDKVDIIKYLDLYDLYKQDRLIFGMSKDFTENISHENNIVVPGIINFDNNFEIYYDLDNQKQRCPEENYFVFYADNNINIELICFVCYGSTNHSGIMLLHTIETSEKNYNDRIHISDDELLIHSSEFENIKKLFTKKYPNVNINIFEQNAVKFYNNRFIASLNSYKDMFLFLLSFFRDKNNNKSKLLEELKELFSNNKIKYDYNKYK